MQSLLGEQCESSTHNQALSYSCNRCRFLSTTCGDEEIDPGEECDEGVRNSSSPNAECRPDCSLPRCGDAVLDSVELCDDGNRLNGDGCDRYCLVETQVASDQVKPTDVDNVASGPYGQVGQGGFAQGRGFPQYPNYQQLPYQLPIAQLQPLMQGKGPVGDTGPAAVAVAVSGMAAGIGWMRRKQKK